jgi:hypothetical protein
MDCREWAGMKTRILSKTPLKILRLVKKEVTRLVLPEPGRPMTPQQKVLVEVLEKRVLLRSGG